MERIDHIIFGCSDIFEGIHMIHQKLGLEAPIAGRHPAFGTINALLSLEDEAYFEIIAPDPERQPGMEPTIFGINKMKSPGLIGWMVKDPNPIETIQSMSEAGFQLGELISGVRERPDGSSIRWELTNPATRLMEGFIPFLINWGENFVHPSKAAPQGCQLLEFQIRHPQAELLNKAYEIINIPIRAAYSQDPGFSATIKCPNGTIIIE